MTFQRGGICRHVFSVMFPKTLSIRFWISSCRVSYAMASAASLTRSLPNKWGTAGDSSFLIGSRSGPLRCTIAVCPLANLATNAFRPSTSSGFMVPAFRTWAAAALVPTFGRVINAIMSCIGPLDLIAAVMFEVLASRILGAPRLSSFSPFVSLMAYSSFAPFISCFRTLRDVALIAFFKMLGAAIFSGMVFNWRMIFSSSASTST